MADNTKKNLEGFNDVDLDGSFDASEFKRAAATDGIANYDFRVPQRRSSKREMPNLEDAALEGQVLGDEIIVNERTKEVSSQQHSTQFKRYTDYVSGADDFDFSKPFLIIGNDAERGRTIISCLSGYLMIGSLDDVTTQQGYVLPANSALETQVQGQIWGAVSRGAQDGCAFTVWMERA